MGSIGWSSVFSLYLCLSFAIGGPLTGLGSYFCLRWWLFWNRNYRGQLLTHGPYAGIRHPFYSAFLILVLGLAILFPLPETFMLVSLSVVVILIYVGREEEALKARYGKSYKEYMRRVPWKLIPRLY
jgi:protein-S-isoprenylcysteine O-methyltransferase Ste14